MLYNLKIEMLKKGIEINDIAKAIGQHRNTAADKISGKRSFSIPRPKPLKKPFFLIKQQNIYFLLLTKKKRGEEMLDCNYQLKNTVLEKEKGNSIISKIMESLKGLNVTTAEFLLEECKKEIYQTAKI